MSFVDKYIILSCSTSALSLPVLTRKSSFPTLSVMCLVHGLSYTYDEYVLTTEIAFLK